MTSRRRSLRGAGSLLGLVLVACASDPGERAPAPTVGVTAAVEVPGNVEPAAPREAVRFVPVEGGWTSPAPSATDLVVGDQVQITVLGQEEMSLLVPVPPRGAIELPVVGSVPLLGKACDEVSDFIETSLRDSKFLVDPKVSVVVAEFAPRQVFVVEGVEHPQAYDMPMGSPLHLTQVISMAGGLAEGADPTQAMILRRSQDQAGVIQVDLRALMDGHDMASDPPLRPGDTVIVRDLKQGEGVVYVTGKVKKAGAYRYPLREGLTFFQAIVLAGGLDKYAKPSGAVLMREVDGKRKVLSVDLEAVLKGELERDVKLQSQDVLFVPESFF